MIERQPAVIRAASRREGVGLVAYLPKARSDDYPSATIKRRAEERRRKVNDALARLYQQGKRPPRLTAADPHPRPLSHSFVAGEMR